MKRLLTAVLAALLVIAPISTAKAAEVNSTVTFTENQKLVYENANSVTNIAPGQTFTQTITLKNDNARTADFYMDADVLAALEADRAAGAGYDVKLTVSGQATPIYDSTLGGYVATDAAGSTEGLKELNNGALEDFILVGTLPNGSTEDIVMTIVFDGEAMDSTTAIDYTNKLAQLGFTFQVAYEDPASPRVVRVVRTETGQTRYVRNIVDQIVPLAGVNTGDSALIGVAVLVVAAGIILLVVSKRKKAKA